MDFSKKTMTIKEFCKELSISRTHFYNLKKQDHFPRAFTLGRKVVFLQEEVFSWLEKQTSVKS